MYINPRKTKESIDFCLYQRVSGKRKFVVYLSSIKHKELNRELALKEFWYQVETKLNNLDIPENEITKLSKSISKYVAPPKKPLKKKRSRQSNDYYQTQKALVHVFLHDVEVEGNVFEPCVGEGHAIAKFFNNCKTNDADSRVQADFNLNAASPEAWKTFGRYDWIITNPPFNLASEILPLAWDNCNVGVAFLLRITYFEPCGDRGNWLQENGQYLYHEIYLNPRPKFRTDSQGTDTATVVWRIWRKDFNCRKQLRRPPTFAYDFTNRFGNDLVTSQQASSKFDFTFKT